jgi:glycosyltransferase involved in cell wall biosynthesis
MTSHSPHKRILHVYQSPSYSGAEAYARDVALWHVKNQNEVVFLAKKESPLFAKLSGDKKELKGSSFHVELDERNIDFHSFDAIILHSTRELKAHWPRLLWARRGGKKPCIVLYSHIWISHSKRDPLHYLFYKLIDQFWASSEASKRNLDKLLPMNRENIRVVRYGRDIEAFEKNLKSRKQAREHLKIPLDAKVVGTMSRVDKGKGSRELFDSAISLLKEYPNLHFLMIGPATASDPKALVLDREFENELEALNSVQPSVRSRVHKVGRLDEGSSYLSAFDLFVLATYKENFALTLLEAQLAGLPCLATNSGGSPDLVVPGKTGWLFEPESKTSLESAVRHALSEESKWSAISRESKEQVRQAYRLDRVLNELDRHLGI